MVELIPFHIPWLSGNEKKYIDRVIELNRHAGNGSFTKRCQDHLEQMFGIPNVLLTTSCTAALELSAMAYDFNNRDEVIVPSYTFVSTASAFLRTGAKIVFAEIDPNTLMLDPIDVERKITKQTKAVVPVHYAGFSADLGNLESICEENNLVLIEDAAQGLCSKNSDSKYLGSVGSLGCISFHETKIIHSGLGGALFVNDESLIDRVEEIWERGTNRTKMFKGLVDKYSWVQPGSSFYPSELQAAFLLAQLESIEENLKFRENLTSNYLEKLGILENKGLLRLQSRGKTEIWNYHAVVIILNSVDECDNLRKYLKEKGIIAYIGYVPLHSSKMGKGMGWKAEDLPITEEYSQRVLRLPLHHEMSKHDVSRVCSEIEIFLDRE